AKRDFSVTPEPRGKAAGRGKADLAFVIQKHAASHLHYDFRLELDGVLLSWAVPKGPSFDPADKRLAMHVEDHPIEYGDFEGVIPAKQYGAGTVMLWDRGTWHPIGDPDAGYKKGHLKFTLDGEKLAGAWTLIRTHGSKYGGDPGKQAWLLIKERDADARDGGVPIVESAPNSVATGRSLADIAAARSNIWQSTKSAKQNVRAGAIERPAAKATKRAQKAVAPRATATSRLPEGAKRGRMPATMSPMLTTLVSSAPSGDDWLHEIKYDGYRMLARIERGKARLFSRSGKDWTQAFRPIAADLAKLPVKAAWIDGEAVVLDASGRSSFQALQNALSSEDAAFTYFAFDLMHRDGIDLRDAALAERKRLLREVVGDGHGTVRVGPEVQGHGDEFFRQACSMSLEGAICKRVDAPYRDGLRTRDWVKVKCTQQQEMVIGGYTDPQGSRTGFGALMLGVYEGKALRYAGKVGTGFNDAVLADIHKQLTKRERGTSPFANPPRGYEAKGAHWVEPDLVAQVAFTEWSTDGALRHPSFLGLRMDKKAREVVREKPMALPKASGASSSSRTRASTSTKKSSPARISSAKGNLAVAGIAISNPDKPYFPDVGLAKIDIARYYEAMAARILPHIKDRPLSLVRCPDGWNGQCFYQKNADPAVNAAVARIEVPEKNGTATYMGASTAAALVSLVQWGVIEIHPWGSRKPKLGRPDQLIFDFDPDDAVPWKDLVTAVELLRTLLRELDLTGFLKTTGGKGLHVVLPIRATLEWDEAKAFTRAVADFMVRTFADRFVATVSKERRKGRIFIDYLRNAEGATAIAPYAVRARAGAPVSMPIHWDDLAKDVRFDHFNVANAAQHLARRKRDPWAEFAKTTQTITRAHRKRMGEEP
ncbi:MAG: DNA ligase D, partial [Betaproteobacteria bacterium]